MGFTKRFGDDPLGKRIYALVYGDPKIGKTHMVLDLVRKHGDYVVLFSLDKGTIAVRQDPETFKGKLAIAYPSGLREMRSDMVEATTVISKLAKAVPRSKIWVVVDTATHLQMKLLAEARKINVLNPDSRDPRSEYVRDAVVEADWNVNLAHMNEVADFLVDAKCNVVVTAHAKQESVDRKKTGRMVPALSGQSYSRFVGDADAILHLTQNKEGKRYLEAMTGDGLGGDRTGNLSRIEEPDLKVLQERMIGVPPQSAALTSGEAKALPEKGEAASEETASQS